MKIKRRKRKEKSKYGDCLVKYMISKAATFSFSISCLRGRVKEEKSKRRRENEERGERREGGEKRERKRKHRKGRREVSKKMTK